MKPIEKMTADTMEVLDSIYDLVTSETYPNRTIEDAGLTHQTLIGIRNDIIIKTQNEIPACAGMTVTDEKEVSHV